MGGKPRVKLPRAEAAAARDAMTERHGTLYRWWSCDYAHGHGGPRISDEDRADHLGVPVEVVQTVERRITDLEGAIAAFDVMLPEPTEDLELERMGVT